MDFQICLALKSTMITGNKMDYQSQTNNLKTTIVRLKNKRLIALWFTKNNNTVWNLSHYTENFIPEKYLDTRCIVDLSNKKIAE